MSKFSISNLDLYYDNGAFKALKNINLEIEPNEITAFIGPSGCGKSTFLKTLNRMNDLVENVKIDGNVRLDGADIFNDLGNGLRHLFIHFPASLAEGGKERNFILAVGGNDWQHDVSSFLFNSGLDFGDNRL